MSKKLVSDLLVDYLERRGVTKLFGLCGLDQKHDAGICFFHSIDAHLMPEFIGQGRVDHDQLKILFRHAPPGFGPAGNDHRAAVAHFGQPCSDILVGACTGTYDQCTSHFLRSFLLHTLFCRGQMALK